MSRVEGIIDSYRRWREANPYTDVYLISTYDLNELIREIEKNRKEIVKYAQFEKKYLDFKQKWQEFEQQYQRFSETFWEEQEK